MEFIQGVAFEACVGHDAVEGAVLEVGDVFIAAAAEVEADGEEGLAVEDQSLVAVDVGFAFRHGGDAADG